MFTMQKETMKKTWLIKYVVRGLGATNVMGIPADSEEKAIEYFNRHYYNPEKVMTYVFVECLGNQYDYRKAHNNI